MATRARTADVVEFFEARYGVRVPDLEVHIGANDAALDEATLSAEGASAWVGFGQYRDGFLFIRMDVSEHAIEHLYFHAIQDYLAEGRHWGPWWLGEGAAVYATHLYQDARDERSASEAMDFDRWASSHTSVGLQELEADSPVAPESFSTPTESLAALAVAWLIQEAGEDSLIAYYQLLPESERWTEAFESAFGLPFSEVYPAFAAYRAEVVAVRRDVTGVVLGPDGEPVEDWRVDVEAFPSGAQRQSDLREHAASEDFNGDFTSRLPDGTYALSLSTRCGRGWVDLGWYGGETGFTTSYADATDIFVEGQDVEGLTIRLPALPDEMFPERCSYGPRVAVSGVVIGPDGQPRSNVYLSSHDPVAGIWPDNTIASADGSFTLHLPAEAAYQIGAGRICEREGKSIVISGQRYAVESDTHANDEGHVVVASADITGITVQLLSPFECGSSGQQG